MAKVLSPTVQRSVEDASYDQSLCYNSIKSDASYPRSDGAGGTPMSYLPPGPRWTVWQTIAFARDPFGTVLRYARRYGDPFTLKLPPGPLVLTGTPEGIREIFTAPPQVFASYSAPFLAPLVGEHSVLLLDGAAHRRGRSVIMPPFHGAYLQTYGHVIQH